MSGPILFLGRGDSAVLAHLRAVEPRVEAVEADRPVTAELLDALGPRFAVSHGYRRILRGDTLARLPERIVNLHISLLPFNRGVHPALWSVLEGTPAGVTIHHIDAGLDTGDIVAQRPVELADHETFAGAYARLQSELLDLFRATWPELAPGRAARRPQPPGGTLHRLADYDAVAHLLPQGWDTPVGPLGGVLSASSAPRPR